MPKMLGTHVQVPVPSRCLATLTHAPSTVIGDYGGNGLPAPKLVGMAVSQGKGFILYLHNMVAIIAQEIPWILNTVMYRMI